MTNLKEPLLTEYQREVLSRMNKGLFLLKKKGFGEGLGYAPNTTNIFNPLKKGTVEGLVELGMVFKSKNINEAYFLTNEGRKYK